MPSLRARGRQWSQLCPTRGTRPQTLDACGAADEFFRHSELGGRSSTCEDLGYSCLVWFSSHQPTDS